MALQHLIKHGCRILNIQIYMDRRIHKNTLSLNHIYGVAGKYAATVRVSDSGESATLEIPVHVVPEPATLLLLGIGGMLVRKRNH